MAEGLLLVLSGPSGVGKSTVIRGLLQRNPQLYFSVSATTRSPRPGEADGRDYRFLSQAEFDALRIRGALLEYAGYVNKSYGTPAEPVDTALAQGRDVLLDIEPQGAFQVRQKRPGAVLVYLTPPSWEELERRLHGRGDTDEAAIQGRLKQARWEYTQAPQYDYLVCNDTVEHALHDLQAILDAEKSRAHRRLELLQGAETAR